MSSKIEQVSTHNGFTFKRKRVEDEKIIDQKKVKKFDEQENRRPEENIEVNLITTSKPLSKRELDIPKKSILRESRFPPRPEDEKKSNDKAE
jgi:hypothetical protein